MQLNSKHEKINELWNYYVFHVLVEQRLRPAQTKRIEMGSGSTGSHDISTAWLLFQNKETTNVFYANYKAILKMQKLIFLSLPI